jgi:guanylate kinase
MSPLVVVSAPSGAGKSSFCERAVADFHGRVVDSVSYTTRAPREGERDGSPYYFVSQEKFLQLKSKNFFIETAEVWGNFYGTPRDQVDKARAEKKILVMDIDVQGADSFRRLYPDATYVFILPPSIDELRRRLEKRDRGKTSNLEARLKGAAAEMARAKDFQHQIINDDFDVAYGRFKKIIEDLLKQV